MCRLHFCSATSYGLAPWKLDGVENGLTKSKPPGHTGSMLSFFRRPEGSTSELCLVTMFILFFLLYDQSFYTSSVVMSGNKSVCLKLFFWDKMVLSGRSPMASPRTRRRRDRDCSSVLYLSEL